MAPRWIIHADLDAFFAAVEQRDNPALRGKPVMVGGAGGRGVVTAASYEARAFGVHAAMPGAQAWRLCPHGIFVKGVFRKYQAESKRVMSILSQYSPTVEALSIDEAFLDATGLERLKGGPVQAAEEIRQRVRDECGLAISIGIASSKHVAKVATNTGKPDGLVLVPQGEERAFLAPLPIRALWGVGPQTGERLRAYGINTIGQLAAYSPDALQRAFGKWGVHAIQLAKGRDSRPVSSRRPVKSVSNESTFSHTVFERETLLRMLMGLAEEVGRRLRAKGLRGRAVALRLRSADFATLTRQTTLLRPTAATDVIYAEVKGLLAGIKLQSGGYRLVGVGVHDLDAAQGGQLPLWSEAEDRLSQRDQAIDAIREKFGKAAVLRAPLLAPAEPWVARRFGGNPDR
jgi:DNA polymerase-4